MNDDFPCCKHGNEHVSPNTPPTSPLPDLSRWYPVPVGATIPAGTEYAYRPGRSIYFNSAEEGTTQYVSDEQRYTEHPIPDPNAWATDRIPLWPVTPPTSIDPADIKVGMRVRRVHDRGPVVTVEGIVDCTDEQSLTVDGMYLSHGIGDWFLIADAPDPDAHWIRAIAEATPETAATVYAAIKGEQA